MVADEVSVNVAPLAVSLTGAGTTTLGSAGVAARAAAAGAVPTVTMRTAAPISERRMVSASLRQNVELRHVPAGQAHHRRGALQVGGLPADRDALRLTGPERDVVAVPDAGLQLVVPGQFRAAGGTPADVGAQEEPDGRRGRRVGDRHRGEPVGTVGPGLR